MGNVFKTNDGIELYCEYDYETTPEILRSKKTNGCGPGGWKFDIVPDTMYGLNISDACNIHDWMYFFGVTTEDKNRADRVFLNNLIRLIDQRTTKNIFRKMLLGLRHRRAKTYYEAVSHFGGPAFWSGKKGQPK